jgi:hypothetical protein
VPVPVVPVVPVGGTAPGLPAGLVGVDPGVVLGAVVSGGIVLFGVCDGVVEGVDSLGVLEAPGAGVTVPDSGVAVPAGGVAVEAPGVAVPAGFSGVVVPVVPLCVELVPVVPV